MRAARPRSATSASVAVEVPPSAMIPAVSGARPPPLHPAARLRLECRRRARRRPRAGLLLRAAGRRPGPHPEDLLRPRADRADLVRVLRLGRVEGLDPPAHAP